MKIFFPDSTLKNESCNVLTPHRHFRVQKVALTIKIFQIYPRLPMLLTDD